MEDLIGKFFKEKVIMDNRLLGSQYFHVIKPSRAKGEHICASIWNTYDGGVNILSVRNDTVDLWEHQNKEEITSDEFYAAYAQLMKSMNDIVSPDND